MLIGYNNDVQYRGKTFHIQTEDRGAPSNQIETQIFHSGAILDTRIVSYADQIKNEKDRNARNETVKALMKVTHRELYKKLFSGEYDHFAGLEPLAKDATVEVEEQANSFNPSQERVPDAARELEERGASAFDIKEGGDHVDLKSLKNRLAKLGAPSEPDEDEEEEELRTQVVSDLDALPQIVQSDAAKRQDGAPKPLFSLHKKNARPQTASTQSQGGQAVDAEIATGSNRAWQGCLPPREDLSLLPLIESLLS